MKGLNMNDKDHKDWYTAGFILALRTAPQKSNEQRAAEASAKATFDALMARLAKNGQ